MKEFIKYAHDKNMNNLFMWLIMNLCWLVCYKLSHSYAIFWFALQYGAALNARAKVENSL